MIILPRIILCAKLVKNYNSANAYDTHFHHIFATFTVANVRPGRN